jgi:hypothetical protein
MELAKFKKLSKIYSKFPLAKEIWDTAEYREYMDAFDQNKECMEWELKRRIKDAGINYKNHCCILMAYRLIEDKKSKNKFKINYDSVITYRSKSKDYGIPIHDGGYSYIVITYCPWCGSQLKAD